MPLTQGGDPPRASRSPPGPASRMTRPPTAAPSRTIHSRHLPAATVLAINRQSRSAVPGAPPASASNIWARRPSLPCAPAGRGAPARESRFHARGGLELRATRPNVPFDETGLPITHAEPRGVTARQRRSLPALANASAARATAAEARRDLDVSADWTSRERPPPTRRTAPSVTQQSRSAPSARCSLRRRGAALRSTIESTARSLGASGTRCDANSFLQAPGSWAPPRAGPIDWRAACPSQD